MSTSFLSAPTFAVKAIEPDIVSSMLIEDELVVTQRWVVRSGDPFCEKTVGEVLRDCQCGVIERRDRKRRVTLLPPPEIRLEVDDTLLVQGRLDTLAGLKAS